MRLGLVRARLGSAVVASPDGDRRDAREVLLGLVTRRLGVHLLDTRLGFEVACTVVD